MGNPSTLFKSQLEKVEPQTEEQIKEMVAHRKKRAHENNESFDERAALTELMPRVGDKILYLMVEETTSNNTRIELRSLWGAEVEDFIKGHTFVRHTSIDNSIPVFTKV